MLPRWFFVFQWCTRSRISIHYVIRPPGWNVKWVAINVSADGADTVFWWIPFPPLHSNQPLSHTNALPAERRQIRPRQDQEAVAVMTLMSDSEKLKTPALRQRGFYFHIYKEKEMYWDKSVWSLLSERLTKKKLKKKNGEKIMKLETSIELYCMMNRVNCNILNDM